MNQQTKTIKIKVNNGQELIQKAKEYKNSGGEWKLRERYLEVPIKEIGKRKNKLGWGIVISNGKQAINIFSTKHNVDYEELVEEGLVRLDECNAQPELWRLFPEAQYALDSGNERNKKLSAATRKELKKDNEPYALKRYLVAEDHLHLKQILNEYVRENENKVYQSANPHFSGWVEIIDGQDSNIYLYVGEKNDNGGREIKIGIKKEEFENCKRDEEDTPRKALEDFWGLFTLGRPQTPAETKKYYSSTGGLEENWQTVNKFWQKTCRWTLEQLRNDLMKGQEFWDNEPNEETRTKEIRAINQKIAQINNRLEDMKKNQPEWYNNYDKFCPDCGNRMCCHHWGNCGKSKKNALFHNLEGESDNQSSTSPKSNNKNNQINNSEKSQLLQYFIAKGIKKITLDNGKLIIEYNNTAKTTEENKDQQLQKYRQIIQSLPNKSLSLSELQANNSSSYPVATDKNKNLYTGLVVGIIGGVVLIGIIVLLVSRRKRKIK